MSESLKNMNIWQHINELRKRLLLAVAGLLVCVLISFIFCTQLMEFLAEPIGGLSKLQSIEVTENMSVFMKVSLLSGVILALPWILYQLLAFVMPGLNKIERRWILVAIPFASIFFIGGVAFTYIVMLPVAVPFLMEFLGVTTVPRLGNYFSFITNLMFWVGVAFESPLVVFILAKLKLITWRALLKQWRIAIVVIAILAAVITPTGDPINMSILMLPLLFLYFLSIVFAWLARRNESMVE
jgi:sec-independent protein translocase protein TatC